MSKKAELLALVERVESGSGSDFKVNAAAAANAAKLFADLYAALGDVAKGPRAVVLLTSVDAVEALRERLLPESAVFVEVVPDRPCWCGIRIGDNDENEAYAATEPLARLAAVLRAYADGVE